jgi:hypothetical protein
MGCKYPPNLNQNYQCLSAKYQELLAYSAQAFAYNDADDTLYYGQLLQQ